MNLDAKIEFYDSLSDAPPLGTPFAVGSPYKLEVVRVEHHGYRRVTWWKLWQARTVPVTECWGVFRCTKPTNWRESVRRRWAGTSTGQKRRVVFGQEYRNSRKSQRFFAGF